MITSHVNNTSIEDVPINGFHQLLSIRSGGGYLLAGYILSMVGVVVVPMSAALEMTAFLQGMVAASALAGMFIGGLIGGWLTHRLGRRWIFFVGPVVFVVCSIAQLSAASGTALGTLRLLLGIGIGIDYPVAGALLVEFIPRKKRAPRIAMLVFLWFLGAATAYITGNLVLNMCGADSWRMLLASASVPAFLLLLIRWTTPESPRWLVSKGRLTQAEGIIKRIYGPDFSLRNLSEEPLHHKTNFASVLRAGYGKRLLFVIVFWNCAAIPIFAICAFAPKLLQALNLSPAVQSYGAAAIMLSFAFGCAIATQLVKVVGRRPLLIHSFLWSALAIVGMAIFSVSGDWRVLPLFGLYAIAIGGAQILQLVYPLELFPTELRSLAMGVGVSLSRIGAAVGTWFVPISLETLGVGTTLFVAAAICFVGFVVSVALAPETRQLSLGEAASLPHR